MKSREQLLYTKAFWMTKIQNDLYGCVEEYMTSKGINRTQLADELGVTKSYVTQVLNGDFNHRLSKLVELSLAIGKAPNIEFQKLTDYIEEDLCGMHSFNKGEPYSIFFNVEVSLENNKTHLSEYKSKQESHPIDREVLVSYKALIPEYS